MTVDWKGSVVIYFPVAAQKATLSEAPAHFCGYGLLSQAFLIVQTVVKQSRHRFHFYFSSTHNILFNTINQHKF